MDKTAKLQTATSKVKFDATFHDGSRLCSTKVTILFASDKITTLSVLQMMAFLCSRKRLPRRSEWSVNVKQFLQLHHEFPVVFL